MRRGPNCWLVGGLTCVGLVIIGAIAIFAGFYSLFRGPLKGAIQSGAAAQMCKQHMLQIQQAVDRYHTHTGTYPDALTDLVPTYLPDRSVLHCSMDTNPDPSHVTYEYSKPTETTPGTAPLLTLHWNMSIKMMGTSQTVGETEIVTVNGEQEHSQTQNMVTTTTGGP